MSIIKELRALLGNSVRFSINVDDPDTCIVRARWACGCMAIGSSFGDLKCTICNQHGEHVSAA